MITHSSNDETPYPIKADIKKKVLVSIISMPYGPLQKDMAAVFRITKGGGNVFWKIWVDLETSTIKIEFCGITEQKDVTMTSSGKGELKEAGNRTSAIDSYFDQPRQFQ